MCRQAQVAPNCTTSRQIRQKHTQNGSAQDINSQPSPISLFQATHEVQTRTQRKVHQAKTIVLFDMEVQGDQAYRPRCRLHLSGWLSRGAPRRPLFPTFIVFVSALPPHCFVLSNEAPCHPPSFQVNYGLIIIPAISLQIRYRLFQDWG